MVGPWTSMNFRPNFASDWTSFQNGEPMGTPIGKFHMIIMIMECDYIILHILHPYTAFFLKNAAPALENGGHQTPAIYLSGRCRR